jgi:hypothetical protein
MSKSESQEWGRLTVLVLLFIFPTLDSHSYSFVSTAWPNDFSSLTVNNSKNSKNKNELEWGSRVGED